MIGQFKKLILVLLSVIIITPCISGLMSAPVKAAGAVDIVSGKSYYLRNAASGLCLDLQASGVTNGTHFQQYPQ